jgi:CheY-like chemotaxis protein
MLNEPPKRRIPLILHVDDDKAQAETLKSILEGSGFLVLQASTAENALRLFKEEPAISLVTRVMAALSWRMPGARSAESLPQLQHRSELLALNVLSIGPSLDNLSLEGG